MKPFYAISLFLVTALIAAGCANGATPSNTNVSTSTNIEAPSAADTVGGDHHAGETNVAPHEETPTPTSGTAQDHDDSNEPPHRH